MMARTTIWDVVGTAVSLMRPASLSALSGPPGENRAEPVDLGAQGP